MLHSERKAFTMLELTFVIVVIGILSAIAIPKFASTADSAYTTKAQSTLATVRTSLATERQRRILRGDFAAITDLSLTSGNVASAFVFDHFSQDAAGNNTPIFDYPIRACASSGGTITQRACWVKSGTTYTYRFADAGTGADGQADFTLANGRLDCISTDTADCQLITQ